MGLAAFIQATVLGSLGTYVLIPVVVAVLSTTGTLIVTKAGDAIAKRRDRYAQAFSTLVSWVEFPYRVRRRVGDDAQTLAALTSTGHDLQEKLACHQAWIATESPRVARAYREAKGQLDAMVGPALGEAWNSAPIETAAGMNLGDWGPGRGAYLPLSHLQCEIGSRFGWRRLVRPFRRPNTRLSSRDRRPSLEDAAVTGCASSPDASESGTSAPRQGR